MLASKSIKSGLFYLKNLVKKLIASVFLQSPASSAFPFRFVVLYLCFFYQATNIAHVNVSDFPCLSMLATPSSRSPFRGFIIWLSYTPLFAALRSLGQFFMFVYISTWNIERKVLWNRPTEVGNMFISIWKKWLQPNIVRCWLNEFSGVIIFF